MTLLTLPIIQISPNTFADAIVASHVDHKLSAGVRPSFQPFSSQVQPVHSSSEQNVDSLFQKMYDTLRIENEDLKGRLRDSQKEAATVMEKSLIEILLGIKVSSAL